MPALIFGVRKQIGGGGLPKAHTVDEWRVQTSAVGPHPHTLNVYNVDVSWSLCRLRTLTWWNKDLFRTVAARGRKAYGRARAARVRAARVANWVPAASRRSRVVTGGHCGCRPGKRRLRWPLRLNSVCDFDHGSKKKRRATVRAQAREWLYQCLWSVRQGAATLIGAVSRCQ